MDRNNICVHHTTKNKHVALRKESVDRNLVVWAVVRVCEVALRKESVDRNLYLSSFVLVLAVALRKESVDRNNIRNPATTLPSMSLSARRAWIEIQKF